MGVKILQFAEDILIYVRYEDINEAQALLERAVGILAESLAALGLEFAVEKFQSIIFDRRRMRQLIPRIAVGDRVVLDSPTLIYLGVKLDRRMTWIPHINMLVSRASQAIGVIGTLAKVTYGVNPEAMLVAVRG